MVHLFPQSLHALLAYSCVLLLLPAQCFGMGVSRPWGPSEGHALGGVMRGCETQRSESGH